MSKLNLRPALLQRVLPAYRAPFFEKLSEEFETGLNLFAGLPRPQEQISTQEKLDGVNFTNARNLHLLQGRLYLCWQAGLLNWLRQTNPDVLIMEANPRYLHSPAALRWMHARRRPVIGWGLGTGSGILGVDFLRKNFTGRFDALLTYSSQGAEAYARLGYPAERIFVAPNAVTPRPFTELPARPDTLQTSRPVLLFVGRLQQRKRIDLLLQACAALPQEVQPELWVVGEGSIRKELETLAKNIYPAAHFYGEKTGQDLEYFFRRADLFALPGTGGLAIQQAMSYGLPVIAAEADGTQNDLVRPENGWQIPPGSLQKLTTTLEGALQDIPRLRKMGEKSYTIVKNEINLENMIAVFRQAILSVVEK